MKNFQCLEITVKSALNVFLENGYSINPYRGCYHSCAYCYAAGEFWRQGFPEYFPETQSHFKRILVKTNIADVLKTELIRKQPHTIYIGTVTDPYQPCEGTKGITRDILEVLSYLPPREIHILTKGTLILRDIDILKELSKFSNIYVSFTITTLEPNHYKHIEPNAPVPWQRLKAMKKLSNIGINVGVMISPIMPGINDSLKIIREIWNTAQKHGATFFFIDALKLEHSVKKHFFKIIKSYAPGLLPTYRSLYTRDSKPVSFSIYVEYLKKYLEQSVMYQSGY